MKQTWEALLWPESQSARVAWALYKDEDTAFLKLPSKPPWSQNHYIPSSGKWWGQGGVKFCSRPQRGPALIPWPVFPLSQLLLLLSLHMLSLSHLSRVAYPGLLFSSSRSVFMFKDTAKPLLRKDLSRSHGDQYFSLLHALPQHLVYTTLIRAGGGHGNPLHGESCRLGVWRAIVHRVTGSLTRMKRLGVQHACTVMRHPSEPPE